MSEHLQPKGASRTVPSHLHPLVERVSIRDVVARDGLQGEQPLHPEQRVELIARLISAGLRDVEVASFVSPKAVPSMAGAAEVAAATRELTHHLDVTLWALVPNVKGAELATAVGVDHLTITVSASPAYSEKNVHMTIGQAFDGIAAIRGAATDAVLDAVISCCFGSPFDGEEITPDDVARLIVRARDAGVEHVTLADTTGMATPRRVANVLAATGHDVGLHLHDTRGTALLNAWTAMELGVDRFDTALGGLGGSPFAPQTLGTAQTLAAGGNLATEDLVMVLADAGIETGVDLGALLDAGSLLAELVGHELPSRVAAAGPVTAMRATGAPAEGAAINGLRGRGTQ
jgi:hydroxymethylglutaryl-CoA lyase